MIVSIALAVALVCQSDPPPPPPGSLAAALQAPRTPTETATPATPEPPKSVADLFRERNAREAAARAAESPPPPPTDDSGYHCRRTATSLTCGTDEEAMRRTEEKAKAALDQILSPD